ncbi:MAG: glycoside hydrolase family 20 zincin-like fold domain-containing protein, partial [Polaribacter sp.]|nr:glycoside hydrolase family 20 zincin-like fold domain-containing protein [Polaribacter sp.]
MKSVISTITIIFCFSLVSLSLNAQNLELSDKAITDNIFETRFTSKELESAPVKLIPYPQNIFWDNNKLAITDIYIKDVEKISPQLISEINHIFKKKNITINKKKKFVLRFKYNDKILKEGYELKVSKSGIYIAASGEAGFFYALQTLRQLIKTENDTSKIHLCKIKDKPQFP